MPLRKNTATNIGTPKLKLTLTSQAPSQTGYKIISNQAVLDKFVFPVFPAFLLRYGRLERYISLSRKADGMTRFQEL